MEGRSQSQLRSSRKNCGVYGLQFWIGDATRFSLGLRSGCVRGKLGSRRAAGVRRAGSGSVWEWLETWASMASRCGAYLSAVFLISAVVYGLVLGGHLAAWQGLASMRMEKILIASGFGINEVIVKGRNHMSRARIDEALEKSQAQTIFDFDTRAARARLERVGWVESARVMRLWPSTLVVEVQERIPFARWHIRGHNVLIDRKGALLGPVTATFSALPRVEGEGANTAAARIFKVLEGHEAIARKVTHAQRVEQRRWDLWLRNGLRIQLPEHGISRALQLVQRLLAAELPEGINTIDMRVPDRIALRRSTPKPQAPGSTTQLSERRRLPQAQPL